MCAQPYFAAAGTGGGECVSCTLARAEADAAQAAHERKHMASRALGAQIKTRFGARLLVAAILLVLGGAFVAARAVQKARDDAAERHRLGASADVYVIKIDNWKWRMCRCEDVACAEEVKAEFERWQASESAPSDSDVRSAAKSATTSLLDCYERIRR